MVQDQSAHPHQQQPTVIAWDGSDVLRSGWSRLFGGMRRQRWLVPALAILGGVALFASLIGEWQITHLRPAGDQQVMTAGVGVGWIRGWSAPYLMGFFAVAACLTLVLFGPRTSREHLRVTGIAMCGLLFAVLVAITVDLGRASVVFEGAVFSPIHAELELSHGPGLMAAYAAVACSALALLLAGRPGPVQQPHVGPPEGTAAEQGSAPAEDDWPWRRPRSTSAELPGHDNQPLDLAVGPTTPFVPPDVQDDR